MVKRDNKGRFIEPPKNSRNTVRNKENEKRMKLYKKGLSDGEIARKVGLSQSGIWKWRQSKGLSPNPRGKRFKIVEPYFSYILGVLYGDGYVKVHNRKDGYDRGIIRLNQKKEWKPFCCQFKEALENIGLNPCIFNYTGKTDMIGVEAKSIKLAKWFSNRSLKEIKDIVQSNKEFIRGFYESDGGSCIEKEYSRWRIHFTNSKLELLEIVNNMLIGRGYTFLWEKQGSCPRLVSNRRKQNFEFMDDISPCIKKDKWENKRGR